MSCFCCKDSKFAKKKLKTNNFEQKLVFQRQRQTGDVLKILFCCENKLLKFKNISLAYDNILFLHIKLVWF